METHWTTAFFNTPLA